MLQVTELETLQRNLFEGNIRLSFSWVDESVIEAGIMRLAAVVKGILGSSPAPNEVPFVR